MTVETTDPMRRTELHYAALNGRVENLKALLASGVDAGVADAQGLTALHLACQENRADAVKVLLEAGAPVEAVDQWGNTPLWRAVFNAKGDPQVIHLLVQAGATPDRANLSGVTPRQLAHSIANYDISGYFPATQAACP